jgi:hypothetical protein
MPYYGSQPNGEFTNGLNHMQNPARANVGSITLNSSEQSAVGPHAVLATTMGTGSPADTDAGIEFGQQSVGNMGDAEQAGQSMQRMMMQRAAGIGTDDGVA